jgi:hypothetical protein
LQDPRCKDLPPVKDWESRPQEAGIRIFSPREEPALGMTNLPSRDTLDDSTMVLYQTLKSKKLSENSRQTSNIESSMPWGGKKT